MRKMIYLIFIVVLAIVAFPAQSRAATNELPCWLSPDALMGYQYWGDPNFCIPPHILLDDNAPDQLKDQIICEAMHQYDPAYTCLDFVYDENGMHVLDSNGKPLVHTDTSVTSTTVSSQPTAHHLPKTGINLVFVGIALILVLVGIALTLFPTKKRGLE